MGLNGYYSHLQNKSNIYNQPEIAKPKEELNPMLFEFQKDLVIWALEKGKAAIFADCGLGKTPVQLEWANIINQEAGGNVLILTPLAVSYQTIRESEKFGIESQRSNDGTINPITVTNYERLKYFNPADFAGVVCDESSILKSFSGVRRGEITQFMRKIPYRLLCTATAAPNDYTELGTSSEALGRMGYVDMLNRFFKNDKNNSATGGRFYGKATEWRLKGYAEGPFWQWVCSWARALRKPSDLGYGDSDFILKPLTETVHVVKRKTPPRGRLFDVHALNIQEQREVVKATIKERCEKVAELVNHDKPALIWCHLNEEGKSLKKLIPDSVEVSGSDSDEAKESKLLSFIKGDCRVLVTKPKIGGWGLNFQHCSHVVLFPSHSFEQYYQAIRRCWRFGQQNPVHVDIVMTEGEQKVLDNLQRKSKEADKMFARLVKFMEKGQNTKTAHNFNEKEVFPEWL